MEIELTSLAQANALYDVVEHRVFTVRADETLPELEIDEIMELVGFMVRLRPLIEKYPEE